jgi:hypothetical protein
VAERRNAYLLILGHREGLAWVLRNQKMAFSAARASDGKRLAVGDRLYLYTSRGCFHNPTRDRGRVIGEATVASELRALPETLLIGEREFAYTCDLELESLAPFRQGVVIANLVSDLKTFPDASTWSFKLRRPLLLLEAGGCHADRAQAGPARRPAARDNRRLPRVDRAARHSLTR